MNVFSFYTLNKYNGIEALSECDLLIQQRNPDLNSDKASIPLYLFNV